MKAAITSVGGRALVRAGQRKLVLDLGAVSYMDSMCLGEIVSSLATDGG